MQVTVFTFVVGAVSNHARFFNVAPDSGIRRLRLPKKMRARLGKQVAGHARAQDFMPNGRTRDRWPCRSSSISNEFAGCQAR
jgi:hypothetical protein